MKQAIVGAAGVVTGAIIGALGAIIAADIQSTPKECRQAQPWTVTKQNEPNIFYDSEKAQVVVCQNAGKYAVATTVLYDNKRSNPLPSSSSCKMVEGKRVGIEIKNIRPEHAKLDNEVKGTFTVCPL
ncbi:hypothetical protein [Candidatus Thiosymbion oneisti]|uniref:hypothetical protein n=1 Tax=Candidatus Thiosymbion oneisti TaxID=589554 RepID=UPI00114D1FD1|nr:hypothetical protein [Candidatus Thiosymbion oneisti]